MLVSTTVARMELLMYDCTANLLHNRAGPELDLGQKGLATTTTTTTTNITYISLKG